ncbi:hypothetical protein ACV07N_15700 [Roseivirga echinicomitans]
MKNYRGKIILMSGGMPVHVQTTAISKGQAQKIIEAQYAGQIRAWAQQMIPDFD